MAHRQRSCNPDELEAVDYKQATPTTSALLGDSACSTLPSTSTSNSGRSLEPGNVLPVTPQEPSLLTLLFRNTFVYFLLPFLGGITYGFGEIMANELAFRGGWFRFLLGSGAHASVGIIRREIDGAAARQREPVTIGRGATSIASG